MFTINRIQEAHSKIKSGADFPAYIQDLKKLGVRRYVTQVATGETTFHSAGQQTISSGPKFDAGPISDFVDRTTFETNLKLHQEGQSSFSEFISTCVETGVARWEVDTDDMTCTYFDKSGKIVLVEAIPENL